MPHHAPHEVRYPRWMRSDRVGDNGAGIPPERARHIFDPFVVGSDARSGKGSGLGLAITRRIVEKHGGTVDLADRPAPGRSTEFLLRLPLDRDGSRESRIHIASFPSAPPDLRARGRFLLCLPLQILTHDIWQMKFPRL